jgi:hypothetical protein
VRRWLPALAVVAVLTGCASPGPSPSTTVPEPAPEPTRSEPSPQPSPSATAAAPVPRFIGPDDDGRAFAMMVGQTTTLRLTDPAAPEPELDGTAVLLIPVANVAAGDAREWEVRADEPGEATIRSTADPGWTIALTVSAE